MTIGSFNVKQWIIDSFHNQGFKKLTEIQSKTITPLLNNKNIIGVSSTGSGKTLAFLIPTFNKIELNDDLQAIIITPTRELARQIFSQITEFKKDQPKLKAQLLVGGTEVEKQLNKINSTKPQIIVTTPARLHEAMADEKINCTKVNTLILDEADMLMDLGFAKEIEKIIDALENDKLQKMGWSATLHDLLSSRLARFYKNTKVIQVGVSIYENENINHHIIHTIDKMKALDIFLDKYNPYLCLIFCNNKKAIADLVKYLKDKQKSVIALHANLDSRQRKNAYKSIKNLEYQYVIASDLASRGLDIDGASHVLNWNLPDTTEWYVHRAGRCGRGKYTGDSFIIFNNDQEAELFNLQKKGIKFNHLSIKQGDFVTKEYRLKSNKIVFDQKTNSEIRKIVDKKTKVKPGYKKKQKEEIKKIKQKSKRKYLEKKINQDRVKKYKQESRDRNTEFY
ncbi:MAG: DEAD/DEAH box helicase [Mycoplasma sp.]